MKRRYASIETKDKEATGLTPIPSPSSSNGQLQCIWSGSYESSLFPIDTLESSLSSKKMVLGNVSDSDAHLLNNEAMVMQFRRDVKEIMKARNSYEIFPVSMEAEKLNILMTDLKKEQLLLYLSTNKS